MRFHLDIHSVGCPQTNDTNARMYVLCVARNTFSAPPELTTLCRSCEYLIVWLSSTPPCRLFRFTLTDLALSRHESFDPVYKDCV